VSSELRLYFDYSFVIIHAATKSATKLATKLLFLIIRKVTSIGQVHGNEVGTRGVFF